jgi:hypothetical protein
MSQVPIVKPALSCHIERQYFAVYSRIAYLCFKKITRQFITRLAGKLG